MQSRCTLLYYEDHKISYPYIVKLVYPDHKHNWIIADAFDLEQWCKENIGPWGEEWIAPQTLYGARCLTKDVAMRIKLGWTPPIFELVGGKGW